MSRISRFFRTLGSQRSFFKRPFEPLETRSYFAADFASLSSTGTLHVDGDASANTIVAALSSDGMLDVMRDGSSISFDLSDVRRIKVEGGAGDDVVTVVAPRTCTLIGGDGDDSLTGGRGDDSLDGGGGDDVMDGGAGDDFLGGGVGFDTASYASRSIGFSMSLSRLDIGSEQVPESPVETDGTSYASAEALSEEDKIGYFVEAIQGTEFADTLGNSGYDEELPCELNGGGGDDMLYGGYRSTAILRGEAGNDQFENGLFNDSESIYGGAGDDWVGLNDEDNTLPDFIDAGSGRDTLSVGAGRGDIYVDMRMFDGLEDVTGAGGRDPAIIIGNDLDNLITTGGYEDSLSVTLIGGGGNDTLIGGAGDDVLNGDAGDDLLAGAGADDNLHGGTGNDTLGGGSGRDRLYGESGNDLLAGHAGSDRLYGSAGVDTFTGGSGNDFFSARDGLAEALYGGSGGDKAQIDADEDATFSIETLLA